MYVCVCVCVCVFIFFVKSYVLLNNTTRMRRQLIYPNG